jgi:hypothetical protein
LTADIDRLMLGAFQVWQHWSGRFPAVLHDRGPQFDQESGQLLMRHGRFADARPHLRRWWRRRPFDRHAARLLLRSLLAGSGAAGSAAGSAGEGRPDGGTRAGTSER